MLVYDILLLSLALLTILDSRAYNRAVKFHKLLCETWMRLILEELLTSLLEVDSAEVNAAEVDGMIDLTPETIKETMEKQKSKPTTNYSKLM